MNSLTIDQLLRAIDQLSPEDQAVLSRYLQTQTHPQTLSADRKMALMRAAQIHAQISEEPSVRRVDWYSDDGR